MLIRSETETTGEIRIEPFVIANRTKLLLSKRDNPAQRVNDLERLMAQADPNRS